MEKTFNIDDDVDYVYDKLFKDDVEGVKKWLETDEVYHLKSSDLRMEQVSSSEFTSPDCVKAHNINPITFDNDLLNLNVYTPGEQSINATINMNAVGLLTQIYKLDSPYSVKRTAREMISNDDQFRLFINEFTSTKVKSTIYHELSHWLDDTLNNQHINSMLKKASKARSKKAGDDVILQGRNHVGMTDYEVNAQIHSIKQMKRDVPAGVWDRLSFDQMLDFTIASKNIDLALSPKDRSQWRKHILSRMHREGLLGDSMR